MGVTLFRAPQLESSMGTLGRLELGKPSSLLSTSRQGLMRDHAGAKISLGVCMSSCLYTLPSPGQLRPPLLRQRSGQHQWKHGPI
jgi:hypothetical protein